LAADSELLGQEADQFLVGFPFFRDGGEFDFPSSVGHFAGPIGFWTFRDDSDVQGQPTFSLESRTQSFQFHGYRTGAVTISPTSSWMLLRGIGMDGCGR